MTFPAIKRFNTNDRIQNQIQDVLAQAIGRINSSPIIDGVLLPSIALTTSAKQVAHRLGRLPLGYLVVSNSANATVYNGVFSGDFIPLTASAATTVSLWVF